MPGDRSVSGEAGDDVFSRTVQGSLIIWGEVEPANTLFRLGVGNILRHS
jgi:hypothetical protein